MVDLQLPNWASSVTSLCLYNVCVSTGAKAKSEEELFRQLFVSVLLFLRDLPFSWLLYESVAMISVLATPSWRKDALQSGLGKGARR